MKYNEHSNVIVIGRTLGICYANMLRVNKMPFGFRKCFKSTTYFVTLYFEHSRYQVMITMTKFL